MLQVSLCKCSAQIQSYLPGASKPTRIFYLPMQLFIQTKLAQQWWICIVQVNRWASSLVAKPPECSSLTYEIHINVLLQEMNAADEATEQCVRTLPDAVVPQVASEWSLLYVSSVTIQLWHGPICKNLWVVTGKTLQNHRTGKIWGWVLVWKWVLAWGHYNTSHGLTLSEQPMTPFGVVSFRPHVISWRNPFWR